MVVTVGQLIGIVIGALMVGGIIGFGACAACTLAREADRALNGKHWMEQE